jgi:hypothetical protein
MIQKAPQVRRAARVGKSPSTSEISRRRREVQSDWSPAQRRDRAIALRKDRADRRFEAHLRFVEFLLAQAAGR